MSAAALAQNKTVALFAYREVMRAIRDTFKGDQMMAFKAREEARKQFRAGRDTKKPGSVVEEEAIEHALAVAQILRENVVQGEGARGAPNHYKLNIRESTERGDNESIKQPKTAEQERFKNTAKKFQK
ncbi:hypothetical protein KVT40_004908 [Elsinoe batatas]|uniref:Mitochondrial zinc maintenance protein 1, mitochondrial n=1 Tax=Elsinoe batatas TaxID=2601811 RepID=A0A8K0L1Y0_9PEZI|nr:hypothetical protein KVT40_004908 [Elsinoe batatas]